jgi:predicted PurR-regulated permease PerM
VEYLRARREVRHALVISDPQPVNSVDHMWLSASSAATLGIFLLLFGAFLYISRPIVLPITAAATVSLTLAPLVKAGKRHGISPWITAIVIVGLCLGAVAIAAMALAGPVSTWIGRAPEIGATIKAKLMVFDEPLTALRQLETTLFGANNAGAANTPPPNVVMPVMAFLTPAAGELLLFFGTLIFFLPGQIELRNHLVSMFGERGTKLRFLRIMKDIERNLAGYLAVVTVINAAVGIIVGLGAWLIGYPNAAIIGLLAALLNYVPYVGPAIMVVALFGVGLVTFPSLSHALIAPIGFIAITTTEGHFVTPAIVGRRLTLNPLLVILSLAFWTWMWGPFGAFLAVPLSIVALVVVNHLFPDEDAKLPE